MVATGQTQHTQWRFACVFLPDFSVEVVCKNRSYEREQPIVLVDSKEHARIKALNRAARDVGLSPELPLSQARALYPNVLSFPWHHQVITDATNQVLKVLKTVSPRVEGNSEWPGVFWIDARGMRWLGGEAGLAKRAIDGLCDQGFTDVRVGVADSMMTAQAAAVRATSPKETRIIPSKMDRDFLKDLSLYELALPPLITDTLVGLGMYHVRDLISLPVHSLASRFGFPGVAAWRQAQGDDARCLTAQSSPESPESILVLDSPMDTLTPILFGVRGLVEELVRQLNYDSVTASCLSLTLSLEDGSETQHILSPVRPTAHIETISELIRVRLERIYACPLDSALVEIRLRALELATGAWQQSHLGTQKWDSNAVERALDLLNGRFGAPVVFEAIPVSDPRPERRARWSAITQVPIDKSECVSQGYAQVHLHSVRRLFNQPQPIEVKLDERGQPHAVFWAGRWSPVDARGPERLSGRWWQSPFAYEDYRFILDGSSALWARRDAHLNRWALMGWFD